MSDSFYLKSDFGLLMKIFIKRLGFVQWVFHDKMSA